MASLLESLESLEVSLNSSQTHKISVLLKTWEVQSKQSLNFPVKPCVFSTKNISISVQSWWHTLKNYSLNRKKMHWSSTAKYGKAHVFQAQPSHTKNETILNLMQSYIDSIAHHFRIACSCLTASVSRWVIQLYSYTLELLDSTHDRKPVWTFNHRWCIIVLFPAQFSQGILTSDSLKN